MDDPIYPDDFWRGISSKGFILDGHLLPDAFQFDDEVRPDGFRELSINWNDNGDALQDLLTRKKENGNLQFSGGAARLELSDVKRSLYSYIEDGSFSYERKKADGNPFHGNLLVSGALQKRLRTMIACTLAVIADKNIYPAG